MPLRLVPPRQGKTPYWYVRGNHLGVRVDRSTRAGKRGLAQKVLRKWEREIECGQFAEPTAPTFASAAVAYMKDGGERRYLTPLLRHFGETLLSRVDQAAIDAAAIALYPRVSGATRNRHVHTLVSAILKHAGVDFRLRRPRGSRGRVVTAFLWPKQAFRILEAAEATDREFALFLRFLLYTGCRLSEALRLNCSDINLGEASAQLVRTKNGDARAVHLPADLVATLANHPRGLDRATGRAFRFHAGGNLYFLLEAVCRRACGLAAPLRIKRGRRLAKPAYELAFVNFHTFCHTWATWMRRYGGLDPIGLVATGRWRDTASVERYAHAVVSEESRRAELLPVPEKRA